MYLIKMAVYKDKGEKQSAVEIPSFFRYDETFPEVMKYLDSNFANRASVHTEWMANPSGDDPVT